MLFVLLVVGAVVLARAPRSEDELESSDTLVWADVERQFERVDRQGAGSVDGSNTTPGPDPGTIPGADHLPGRGDPRTGGADPADGTQPGP